MQLWVCKHLAIQSIFIRHITTLIIALMKPMTVRELYSLRTGQETNRQYPGTLRVHNIIPPFPRTVKGKFHILLAHLRQLHLTYHLLRTSASRYDVYFVDQLSTCIPILRALARKRVVFYCHFPDKLLANGANFVDGKLNKNNIPLLKRIYRYPMDWLEEATTSM